MVLLGMTLLSAPLTPLPRIGRCASPVAMEPQLDLSAAFVCAFCFSPVVLGLHWGTEWNEARDRCTSAQKRFEMERLRLMCGEGEAHAQHSTSAPCIDRLGVAHAGGCCCAHRPSPPSRVLDGLPGGRGRAHACGAGPLTPVHPPSHAHAPAVHTPCIIRHACAVRTRRTLFQAAEDFRNFRVAGATRQVVSQLPLLGSAAPRRAPQAAMAMRGQGQTVAKPKAKPAVAEAGSEAGSEAEAAAEAAAAASPGRGGGDPVMQQSVAAEVGLPTGLPWPMPTRLFTREEALDTLFDVGSPQPVERGVC